MVNPAKTHDKEDNKRFSLLLSIGTSAVGLPWRAEIKVSHLDHQAHLRGEDPQLNLVWILWC